MAKKYFKENAFTIALILFSVFLIVTIPGQIKESLVAQKTITPRLFPYISAIGTLICCVLTLIFSTIGFFRHKNDKVEEALSSQEGVEETSSLRSLFCIVLLFAWCAVLKKVGFIISTIVVIFVLSYMLGNRNKISLVAFPIIFTVAIYFIFVNMLHVKLPEILF